MIDRSLTRFWLVCLSNWNEGRCFACVPIWSCVSLNSIASGMEKRLRCASLQWGSQSDVLFASHYSILFFTPSAMAPCIVHIISVPCCYSNILILRCHIIEWSFNSIRISYSRTRFWLALHALRSRVPPLNSKRNRAVFAMRVRLMDRHGDTSHSWRCIGRRCGDLQVPC